MGKRKVGTIKHEQFGIEVPLHLNTDTMQFSAVWERETERPGFPERHTELGRDGESVRAAMLSHIGKLMTMTWEPVIDIVPLHDDASRDQIRATASCSVSVRRFWLGRSVSGTLHSAEWESTADDRKTRFMRFNVPSDVIVFSKDFTLPFRTSRVFRAAHIYLAYTEELWAGLQQIETTIQSARRMLDTVLESDEGLANVAQVGAAALPVLLGGST